MMHRQFQGHVMCELRKLGDASKKILINLYEHNINIINY